MNFKNSNTLKSEQLYNFYIQFILFQWRIKIEQLVRIELPCVKQAMVIGEGQTYLAVLLTLHTNIDEKTKQPGKVLTDEAQRWFKNTR